MEQEQLNPIRHQALLREAKAARLAEEVIQARRLAEHQTEKHKEHLCHLAHTHQMEKAEGLVGDGGQICGACGRVAARAANLCEPRARIIPQE